MRGNLVARDAGAAAVGSIPASAGEPGDGPGERHGRLVYPRECGGTTYLQARLNRKNGLSPRVRGNPSITGYGHTNGRSIPGSAGEPTQEQAGE